MFKIKIITFVKKVNSVCGLWEPNLDQCTFLYKKKFQFCGMTKKLTLGQSWKNYVGNTSIIF